MKKHWTDSHMTVKEGIYTVYDEAGLELETGFTHKRDAREYLQGYAEYLEMREFFNEMDNSRH